MVSLPLDVALSVLTIACVLMAIQLVIVTVELTRLRRDVLLVLRVTSALNHAVNPWASEDEPTMPGRPPRLRRIARWGMWFSPHKRRDAKRPPPP